MTMAKQPKRGRTFEELFSRKKPIIGMIHLPALPGSPQHQLSLDEIREKALADLHALIEGGVDAVLVENYHDSPFLATTVEDWTVVSMTLLVQEIVKASSKPVGINLLRNACEQALIIASFTGASFIRCNFYSGVYTTEQGIIEGCAPQLQRLHARLKTMHPLTLPLIFADVHCKHASPLGSRSIIEEVYDAFERGLADAVIISGRRTGLAPDLAVLDELKAQSLHPILLGSGLTRENAREYLSRVDGAIVGTNFKKDGLLENPVEITRVQALIESIEKKK